MFVSLIHELCVSLGSCSTLGCYGFTISCPPDILVWSCWGLQAKPLSLLHVFHHAVVPTMAFLWLEAAQSLQHLGLLTNAGVHVIMYLYYFLCSISIYPRWKRLITQCQIVQFVFRCPPATPFDMDHSSMHAGTVNGAQDLASGSSQIPRNGQQPSPPC